MAWKKQLDAVYKLDDYQVVGANWLAKRRHALLADVMGIGKSAQAVHGCELVDAKQIVIVCSAAKRFDWERDFKLWSERYRGYDFQRVNSKKDKIQIGAIIAASYENLYVVTAALKAAGKRVDVLIIDEIQYLKSPTAKRTKDVLGREGIVHHCDRVWMLSGTPMLNHPGEMWPWLYTLFPKSIDFGNGPLKYDEFVEKFCTYKITPYGFQITGCKDVEGVRDIVWPLTLRRGEECVPDLPPLYIDEMPIARTEITWAKDAETLAHYENMESVQAIVKAAAEIEAGADFTLDDVEDERGRIVTVRKTCGLAKTRPVSIRIGDMCAEDDTKKVVVFGIFRDCLQLVFEYCKNLELDPVIIWGGQTPDERQRRITKFINSRKCRVLVGQIDALGTGVDGLQHAADEIIFIESSWTYAGNCQAIKRLHRRGQRKPVTARFAVLQDSIDEVVTRVVKRKTVMLTEIFG